MADVVWDQAVYDAAYQRWHPGFQQYVASYRRDWYGSDPATFRRRLQAIENALPGQVVPSDNILIVGCGFGWTIEVARDEFGHQRTWGTDISPFIQANKTASGNLGVAQARADIAPLILNVDVTSPTARTDFVAAGAGTTTGPQAGRGRFDWIITELVMESIDPANYTTFLNALDSLATGTGGVIHIVVAKEPGDQPFDPALGMTARTLAEWVAVRPAHWWLDMEQSRWVLGGGV